MCLVFARLGLFAFGGPAAHIAMMEDELVTKRKWLTKMDFMDLLGFTNLIPVLNTGSKRKAPHHLPFPAVMRGSF
ncbi:chromate transporter [uncultured Trichococcus sp.]|uniref:chromate transporter n=1 Tax=uncultured Trichococcus sp. TaxID=189665 RepID=UPI0029C65090|nr:chromate transporter [uncultured Trichococcus sp.]